MSTTNHDRTRRPRPTTAARHEFGAALRALSRCSGLTQKALQDIHPPLTDPRSLIMSGACACPG